MQSLCPGSLQRDISETERHAGCWRSLEDFGRHTYSATLYADRGRVKCCLEIRMRVAAFRALVCTWVLLQSYCAHANDGPTADIIESSARSVVQVISRTCGDAGRTGSGFIWLNANTVVTANHVVAGCREVWAFVQGTGEIRAKVDHVLTGADLAMLSLASSAPAPPLKVATMAPQINDTVQAIGYYFGVPTRSSVALRLALGSSRLRAAAGHAS